MMYSHCHKLDKKMQKLKKTGDWDNLPSLLYHATAV